MYVYIAICIYQCVYTSIFVWQHYIEIYLSEYNKRIGISIFAYIDAHIYICIGMDKPYTIYIFRLVYLVYENTF